MSTNDMRVMPPEKIRQLPNGQALIIYRNAPAMLVDLKPWTARADGPDIAARHPPHPSPPHRCSRDRGGGFPAGSYNGLPVDRPMNQPQPRDDQEDVEPYTLTELSNGLEELTSRLDQTEDNFGNALEKVSKTVLDMRGQLAELLKKPAEKDTTPQPWAHRATRAQWNDLFEWVDWLQRTYGALTDFDIYPCWPAHLGMVEELAGLFHSWRRVVITDELATATGSSDLTARHDRWLWPLLQRAKGGHYRTTNCKDRHVPERVTSKPTDRQHVPESFSRSLPQAEPGECA